MIIDAQVHVSTGGVPPANHIRYPLSAQAMCGEMDRAGVDRVLVVPPTWEPAQNDYALAAARSYPERFGVVAQLRLDAEPGPDLAQLRGQGVLGCLVLLHKYPEALWAEGPAADRVWAGAASLGLTMFVHAYGVEHRLARIAERHPGLRLVVAAPGGKSIAQADEAAFQRLPVLLELARHNNVALKLNGITGYSSRAFPFANLVAPIEQMHRHFGAHRLFWASDLTRLTCTYEESIAFIRSLPFLDESQKASVLGGGIRTWLNWP